MIQRIILAVFLPLLCNIVYAQDLLVFHVGGDVTATIGGRTRVLKVKDRVSLQTVVNIPYEGSLDLVDEKNSKRYILHRMGKGTVSALSSDAGNSVGNLTARYLSYIKKQMTNEGLVSAQRYSDFATVTREVKDLSMREKFEFEKKKMRMKFDRFREDCNRKYTDFVRQAWKSYHSEKPIALPDDQCVKPVVFNKQENTEKIHLFRWLKKAFSTKGDNKEKEVAVASANTNPDSIARNRPRPLVEIKEVPVTAAEREYAYMPFTFLGAEMRVRIDETKRINIGQINPDRIADVLQNFSTREYDNLLYDCLELRSKHSLCDWAYVNMLRTICNQFCGEGTNESTALLGYLFYQSGYMCRFGYNDDEKLFLLLGTKHSVYYNPDISTFKFDDVNFFSLEKTPDHLWICPAKFPGERYLSLVISEPQELCNDTSACRDVQSIFFEDFTINYTSNKELIRFYDSYPASYVDGDQKTRWAIIANTPMSRNIKEQLYPQLQARIQGLSEVDACNVLLSLFGNCTGPGFNYGYDDEIWGGDRAFYAEETLFYPYCDCEDRAILFTRFVRDLLGLKCVLVLYEGHLSSAVHFSEEAPGAYYTLDGVPYAVADPTYIGSNVGDLHADYRDQPAALIALE